MYEFVGLYGSPTAHEARNVTCATCPPHTGNISTPLYSLSISTGQSTGKGHIHIQYLSNEIRIRRDARISLKYTHNICTYMHIHEHEQSGRRQNVGKRNLLILSNIFAQKNAHKYEVRETQKQG